MGWIPGRVGGGLGEKWPVEGMRTRAPRPALRTAHETALGFPQSPALCSPADLWATFATLMQGCRGGEPVWHYGPLSGSLGSLPAPTS